MNAPEVIPSTPLTDTDGMPWGGNTGVPMGEVSARYFHHCWHRLRFLDTHDAGGQLKRDNQARVADYIKRNMERLKAEYPVTW